MKAIDDLPLDELRQRVRGVSRLARECRQRADEPAITDATRAIRRRLADRFTKEEGRLRQELERRDASAIAPVLFRIG